MKHNPGFVLCEGFAGLRQGVFHSFVSIAAITLAISILSLLFYGALNLRLAANNLLNFLQFEAFISLTIPESQHQEIVNAVQAIEKNAEVGYISRSQAAAKFACEFDPELFNVLKENPLPASVQIKFSERMTHPDSARILADQLLKIEGIDDVIYDQELMELIHAGMRKMTRWGAVFGLIACLLSAGLTFNAVRLKIEAQREAVKLMSLLGTTPGILRSIFLLQGAILGSIGGGIGAVLMLGIAALAQLRLSPGLDVQIPHPYLPILVGCLLGIISGLAAVRRYLVV